MSVDPVVSRVWEIAAPMAAAEGMEIVDIEFRREGSRSGKVLRLYLDKEGGPTLDELARVSRLLNEKLDASPVDAGSYVLEVSSPGINRALKTPGHFSRFVGRRVRVRTREAVDGRRAFLGILREATPDDIVVAQDGREFRIALPLIEKANYEHDWGA
ncbi:MAG TPA: ribosome maturation factor RimP [Candidatus Binatia bacterium]